jgi:branched-subunit amino acid transport protein
MQTEMLWMIVLGCAAATFVWRFLGVLVVRRINANGAIFQWISCVSYAMVAGVLAGGVSLSTMVLWFA